MKFKIYLKFEYKNRRFRLLTLTENNPQVVAEEVDGEVTKYRPATKEEVTNTIRKTIATIIDDNKIRSFVDSTTHKTIIIRFSEVIDAEILVKEEEQ